MMDEIFVSGSSDSRARLLRVFQDFLVSESTKHDALKRGISEFFLLSSSCLTAAVESQKTVKADRQVDMEELVGNTQGFAESG